MAWGRARGLRSDETLKPFLEFDVFERLVAAVDRSAQPLNTEHPAARYARAVSAAAAGPDAGARAPRQRAAARAADARNLSAAGTRRPATRRFFERRRVVCVFFFFFFCFFFFFRRRRRGGGRRVRRRIASRRRRRRAPRDRPEPVPGAGLLGRRRRRSRRDGYRVVPEARRARARARRGARETQLLAEQPGGDDGRGARARRREPAGVRRAPRLARRPSRRRARRGNHRRARPGGAPVGGATRRADPRVRRSSKNAHRERICRAAARVRVRAVRVRALRRARRPFAARGARAVRARRPGVRGGAARGRRAVRAQAAEADPDRETGALHKVGVALLGQGRWAEAHEAWAEAYASRSEKQPRDREAFAALAAQVAKDRAYARASREHASSSGKPGEVTDADPKAAVPVRSPRALHPSAGIFTSGPEDDAALLTPEACAVWIARAEAAAAARGGWTTSRHYAVPTTDLPVHEIPSLLPLWNAFLARSLGPFLHACFPERVRAGGSNVRVHDAFVVRYDAGAQVLAGARRPVRNLRDARAERARRVRRRRTTFPDPIRVTARPDIGGVVAFGGTCVTRGRRSREASGT